MIYLVIGLVAVVFMEVTGNNELAFGLFIALFLLKLIVVGPEPDDNG